MKKEEIEFYEHIEEMKNLGNTCSEILEKINEYPEEIISQFPEGYLESLKFGGDHIFKEQLSEVRVGSGWNEVEASKTTVAFIINDFNLLNSFVQRKLRELKEKVSVI